MACFLGLSTQDDKGTPAVPSSIPLTTGKSTPSCIKGNYGNYLYIYDPCLFPQVNILLVHYKSCALLKNGEFLNTNY